MRRSFLGLSVEVMDTQGNRLLGDVLLGIEDKLAACFCVPLESFDSFSEWVVLAKKKKPNMAYFLEWLEKDANINEIVQIELGDFVSDALLDEFDVSVAILNSLDEETIPDVFCAEIADAVDSLSEVLMQNQTVIICDDGYKLEESWVIPLKEVGCSARRAKVDSVREENMVDASSDSGEALFVA